MAVGFFDGNKADASPDSIKRKREMIARMMASARSPRNIGEGFNAIGNNIAAAMLGYQADTAEKANEAERSRIMGGIGFGGGSSMASAGNPVATGSATGSGATRAVSGKGYDNPQARETYEYALAQGLAPHQAAAYTGAKLAESRFDPNARNPGDGRDGTDSIGTFQWNSGRAQALKQFAAQQGKSWNDPAVQRAFSFAELNGSERAAGQALRNAKTPEDATAAMLSYLRPGGWTSSNPLGAHSAPARLRNTQGILSAFGNMPVVQPGPGAAPMPLARQNAQTAPMPNAAPISGDNRAALLADADYYEQNGNVEAARQMRARAGMAGQAQMASAGPQGDAGQDPGYLGAEQYSGAPAMPTSAGNSYADNEEQTRAMEAQMAAEQGLPYAGNEPSPTNQSDVFSPIPMGAAPNPFLPREPDAMAQVAPPPAPSMDRATFDQITSQTGPIAPTFTGQLAGGVAPSWSENAANNSAGPMGVAPDAPSTVNVPMPPRRPAGLAPAQPAVQQQPAQQPPLDQMTFAQQGAANSMDDRFAAQAFASGGMGQAGPRRSILDGLMGGGNSPFVPAAMRGPQPVVPGQSAPMGGSTTAPAAQAQQTGMITPQYVQAVMSSPVTSEADKRFVMDMYNQQVALQRAEAERARTEAQNRQTARDLGIPESLGGVGPVVTARAQQKYARPEAATTDQRELEQVNRERQNANLPALRMDEWKTQKARAGATSIVNDLTGGSSKQVFDTLKERAEAAQTAATGLNALREARKAVTDGGFFGAGADQRLGFAKLGQLLGFEDGRITNTETFRSAIAPQVAAVMKATVGSTQISNADREFAEKAAGGSIALDDKSINRLLDIMERGSNDIISRHQKQLDAVYPESPDGKFARERALFGVQAPPAPTQTGPARPSSKAEFDALPSGSTFIAPDGTTRRKP